jgi:hypothetical protein
LLGDRFSFYLNEWFKQAAARLRGKLYLTELEKPSSIKTSMAVEF